MTAKPAEQVPPTLATARIVSATAERISRDVETLAGLTAKLRGLIFVDPDELARLRNIEIAASESLSRIMADDIDAAMIRLRDSLAGDWVLNEKGSL